MPRRMAKRNRLSCATVHSTVLQKPIEHAQSRADKTRRAYLVTNMGHVLFSDPRNRRLAKKELTGIACVARPRRRSDMDSPRARGRR